jgi:hypothetical protein
MSPHELLQLQVRAFHAAIIDDCERAACPGQGDAMALRLRNNALALGRMQLTMLALIDTPRTDAPRSDATLSDATPYGARPSDASTEEPAPPEAEPEPPVPPPDHKLSGDALSRFVSSRLEPDQSPYDVWQHLQEEASEARSAKRGRDPAPPKPDLPGAGFRSPSS